VMVLGIKEVSSWDARGLVPGMQRNTFASELGGHVTLRTVTSWTLI
jgi:hypothetical protein